MTRYPPEYIFPVERTFSGQDDPGSRDGGQGSFPRFRLHGRPSGGKVRDLQASPHRSFLSREPRSGAPRGRGRMARRSPAPSPVRKNSTREGIPAKDTRPARPSPGSYFRVSKSVPGLVPPEIGGEVAEPEPSCHPGPVDDGECPFLRKGGRDPAGGPGAGGATIVAHRHFNTVGWVFLVLS